MSGIGAGFAEAAVDDVVNQYQYENTKWLDTKLQNQIWREKHQMEVADLRKAGLNPILSAHGGAGGSSVSLPSQSVPGGSSAGANALGEKRLDEDIEVMETQKSVNNATEGKLQADTKKSRAERESLFYMNYKLMSDAMTNSALQGKYAQEEELTRLKQVPYRVDKSLYESPFWGKALRTMEKIAPWAAAGVGGLIGGKMLRGPKLKMPPLKMEPGKPLRIHPYK